MIWKIKRLNSYSDSDVVNRLVVLSLKPDDFILYISEGQTFEFEMEKNILLKDCRRTRPNTHSIVISLYRFGYFKIAVVSLVD